MSGLNATRGPRITVIIATFNCASLLPRAIASFLEQDYEDKELLIVDGGSTDGTLDVIRAHAPNIAWWVSEPDKGIYDAWNKAIPHASGQWIIFLGSDDTFWDAHSLRDAAPSLAAAPANVGFAYGRAAMTEPSGDLLRLVGGDWRITARRMMHLMAIPHTAAFQRRSAFMSAGLFDPSFTIAGDYELLLRWMILHEIQGAFIQQVVSRMQVGGIADKQLASGLREMILARRMVGLRSPAYALRAAIANIAVKDGMRRVLGERVTARIIRLAWEARDILRSKQARTVTYLDNTSSSTRR